MKSSTCIVTLFIFLMFLAPALAGDAPQEKTAPLQKTTAQGMFHVKMTLETNKLSVGKNSALVTVMDKQGKPVTGTRLTVRPHVARHGETSLMKPTVVEKSDGVYQVRNIYIDMPGDWELKVTVRKNDTEDSAVFEFPGVKRRE
jgi:hypothetical protein